MLPKDVPRVKGLDIAAFMRTANEVGGDYYDFLVDECGVPMIAVGDATGHGLKAGNLVTATKGLLNILATGGEVKNILDRANRAIKQMDLHMLTICLAVVKIQGSKVRFTSAGMPPLIVYRGRTQECETRTLKALPLGAVQDFPYAEDTFPISPGDVVLILTDGLLEIFDRQLNIDGLEHMMESLKRNADKSARELVSQMFEDGKAWGNDAPLADDLTIVVVKATEEISP